MSGYAEECEGCRQNHILCNIPAWGHRTGEQVMEKTRIVGEFRLIEIRIKDSPLVLYDLFIWSFKNMKKFKPFRLTELCKSVKLSVSLANNHIAHTHPYILLMLTFRLYVSYCDSVSWMVIVRTEPRE